LVLENATSGSLKVLEKSWNFNTKILWDPSGNDDDGDGDGGDGDSGGGGDRQLLSVVRRHEQ